MRIFLATLSLFFATSAWAGIYEISASTTYRKSVIDEFNYTTSSSLTASMSYYFFEMSALELSYTQGLSTLSAKASSTDPKVLYKTSYNLMGLDLVLTFAGKESVFQPFIKVGGARIAKKIWLETEVGSTDTAEPKAETVPSAGIGFKIAITQSFSIKTGIDAWISNLGDKDETTDYAGRAGISWMF